ncbi:Putative glucose dehydrogenase B [Pseudooceanicola batsensis HTCC2597]|uniref:Putative glucose dehydrogenase B n=1 Tax=Pseudooceanicola batsensis (strain ATCC BAA-863 / DSM 15984 / KCTC 12145 / HTCC2597) TaxID=252305 RepID=A3TVI2_PSEBH|nr:PQQ-dependent sugar dehydrogenase [Pseudooceanicola batsensis]EAQ04528.1 Putative glucose dehydrogenase B [Pseudooceanicola batsensis HTCC2597]
MTLRTSLLSGAVIVAAAPVLADPTFNRGDRNTDFEPQSDSQFRAELVSSDMELERTTVAGGLVHPWGIDVLPEDAGYLVTERSGQLRHVSEAGEMSDPIAGLPEVAAQEQGGLLDVALGPDFSSDRMIYWTYAKPVEGGFVTAAARGVLNEELTEVTEVEDIFVQTPAASAPMHFGSRIVFDGEGHVFITTGEHFTQEYRVLAQELDNTFGKVVRLNLDGSVPDDNPYVGDDSAMDEIWSYGHRNIQGAWMSDGQLWTIEHGPKGGDEINLTEAGKNYGWPEISYGAQYSGNPVGSGEAQAEGMEQPVYFWDPVIAPAGTVVYEGETFGAWSGDLLISSLHPGGIVRLVMEDGTVTAEERLVRDMGRVRDLAVDDDGTILALTDFEDGRLVRIAPAPSGN